MRRYSKGLTGISVLVITNLAAMNGCSMNQTKPNETHEGNIVPTVSIQPVGTPQPIINTHETDKVTSSDSEPNEVLQEADSPTRKVK